MGVYRELFEEFKTRLLVAGSCFVAGVILSIIAGDPLTGFMIFLPFVTVGVIVLAPAITAIFAQPFSSLFYPSDRFDGPQPMYSVPQSRRAVGAYEEAMSGYEKIAEKYPDEVKPYIEMMNIAILDLRDVERAKLILDRGQALFRDEGTRRVLQQSFDAVVTRMALKPEWLQKQESRAIVPEKLDGTLPVDEPDGLTSRRFHPGGYIQAGKDGFVDKRRKIERWKDRNG